MTAASSEIRSILGSSSQDALALSQVSDTDQLIQDVALKAIRAEDNGDNIMTSGRIKVALTIDGLGIPRQLSVMVNAIIALSHGTGPAAAALTLAAPAVAPFVFLITGPGCVFTSAYWSIPEAREFLQQTRDEIKQLETSDAKSQALQSFRKYEDLLKTITPKNKAQVRQRLKEQALDDLEGSVLALMLLVGEKKTTASAELDRLLYLLIQEIRSKDERSLEEMQSKICSFLEDFAKIQTMVNLEDAKKALTREKLRLGNAVGCLVMGAAQTAFGAVSLAAPEVSHSLGYAPSLTGAAAHAALVGVGVGLGAVYAIRGSIMLARAVKNHDLVTDFQSKLNASESTASALALMRQAESLGPEYVKRRLNEKCLQDEEGNTYTASGIKDAQTGKISAYNDQKRQEYLKRVDKAVYTEQLKYKVSATIAASMIIGGILLVAMTVLSAGTAPIAIGLASALFFLIVEGVFATYDSTSNFEKVRDYFYKKRLKGIEQELAWLSTPELEKSRFDRLKRRCNISCPNLEKENPLLRILFAKPSEI